MKHPPRFGRGRRSQTVAVGRAGHYVGAAIPQGQVQDIALAATLRAAALRLANNLQPKNVPARLPVIASADLRVKIRQSRVGNLILFVVDASGSMAARKRMVAVKGAVVSLLMDAYQKRDRVGLISFRGQQAELLVPPTNSVELAERSLRQMPTGGQTPLTAGLELARQIVEQHSKRESSLSPLLVLVTDGRDKVEQTGQLRRAALSLAKAQIPALVLDSEQGYVRVGMSQEIAGWLGADYLLLDTLKAKTITNRVRKKLSR